MSYVADGSHCRMVPHSEGCSFVAVGWLEPETGLSIGKVSGQFFQRLCSLLSTSWQPPYACAGHHDCALCQFGMSTTHYGNYEFKSSSASELFIPDGTVIFVAPANIAHSISAHHYLPPAEFMAAVEACPPQGSRALLKLFLHSGGRKWVRAMERSQGGIDPDPGDSDIDEMFYRYSADQFPHGSNVP